MKRQRGRGRKPGGGGGGGGNHGNRPFESNGPDVKIRGTAAQIYEKYAQYARDAQSSGDRVKYESYLQHAEHYFRIMAATMPREQRLQQMGEQAALSQAGEYRDNDDAPGEGTKIDEVAEAADDDQPEVEAAEGEEVEAREDEDAEAPASGEERQDGPNRGRNRRRGRRREGGPQAASADRPERTERPERPAADTEARSALDSLARRQGAIIAGG